MLIPAQALRNKDNLKKISKQPGIYKWWISKDLLCDLLKSIKVDINSIPEDCWDIKENLYCVYVGIAAEPLWQRLNWHINQKHTKQNVKSGYLSTLRQTISSIFCSNQLDEAGTNNVIDKMYITVGVFEGTSKSALEKIETSILNTHLYILNIAKNHNSHAPVKYIKYLRKEAKKEALK